MEIHSGVVGLWDGFERQRSLEELSGARAEDGREWTAGRTETHDGSAATAARGLVWC